jgi:Holliday junction resolvasome RuvABC ATP-dependent DNA helicase subunit
MALPAWAAGSKPNPISATAPAQAQTYSGNRQGRNKMAMVVAAAINQISALDKDMLTGKKSGKG